MCEAAGKKSRKYAQEAHRTHAREIQRECEGRRRGRGKGKGYGEKGKGKAARRDAALIFSLHFLPCGNLAVHAHTHIYTHTQIHTNTHTHIDIHTHT